MVEMRFVGPRVGLGSIYVPAKGLSCPLCLLCPLWSPYTHTMYRAIIYDSDICSRRRTIRYFTWPAARVSISPEHVIRNLNGNNNCRLMPDPPPHRPTILLLLRNRRVCQRNHWWIVLFFCWRFFLLPPANPPPGGRRNKRAGMTSPGPATTYPVICYAGGVTVSGFNE